VASGDSKQYFSSE
jgi:hypothetical protein